MSCMVSLAVLTGTITLKNMMSFIGFHYREPINMDIFIFGLVVMFVQSDILFLVQKENFN